MASSVGSAAGLFNLVVFCKNPDRVDYFRQFILAIIKHFPCRVAFIQQTEDGNEEISAEAGSIVPVQSENPISCDQLLIQAKPGQLFRVPFLVLPFILADLPLLLVWDCDPTSEQEILPKLQPYANRLIFDSETIDHLQHFSHRFLAYVTSGWLDMVDLNWSRIGGWREVMTKIFDTEDRILHLRQAHELRITYNATENRFFHHSQTQAIYLQAWLAAQLGWHFCSLGGSQGTSEVRYKTHIGTTTVILQPSRLENGTPGAIFSIELLSPGGIQVLATRKPGTQQVTVHASSDVSCTLPYTLNLRGSQFNYAFLKETLYLYGSQHYRHMVHMLKQQEWTRESGSV